MSVATAPATFIYARANSDSAWRCEWPAAAIGANTVAIPEEQLQEALLGPNRTTAFPWRIRARSDGGELSLETMDEWGEYTRANPGERWLAWDFPRVEGAAIFTRPCFSRAAIGKALSRNGVLTIAESDDNYFAPDRQNLMLREKALGEKGHDMHARAMAGMSRNVFSTVWLMNRYLREYRRRFPGKRLPQPFVCRNHIPSWAWPEIPDYDGPLRVGFSGSMSHVWDVHVAYAAFHAATYHGARTVMVGYSPADPDPGVGDEHRSKKSLAVSAKWAKVISEHIPWVAADDYHARALPLDIGLAPLRKSEFTRGKSDSKLLEYAVSGAAIVCSRHPVYEREGWRHEENCLVASSQEEMALQTQRLIHDPLLRRELAANARGMVREKRNEQVMRDEWLHALSDDPSTIVL